MTSPEKCHLCGNFDHLERAKNKYLLCVCVCLCACIYCVCVCSKRLKRRLTTAHQKEGGCSSSVPDPIVIAKNELEKQ